MALTLKAAITATQTTVDIAGADALSEGDVRSIDSEYVEIRSAAQATLQYGETAYYRATIKRGVQGSAKATHAASAALTAVLPGTGGEGVTAHAELTGLDADDHSAYPTTAEATTIASNAVSTHAAAGDPHTGYRLESDDHSHASTGAQGGVVAAAAIAFTPNGSIAATNVQAAIQEVRDEAGAGALTSVTVNLTAGQIATLNSVPVQVVAAPGANKVIVPVSAVFQTKAGGTPFTNGTMTMVLEYTNNARAMVLGPTDLNDDFIALGILSDAGTDANGNLALRLIALEGDPEDPGGADGTARLTVLYWVMDLA